MNYLERYQNGEYEQVWEEFQSLGSKVREEPHYSQAVAVATETMRRVQRNCNLIISRLNSIGYAFGVYPDGTEGYYSEGPIVPFSQNMLADYEYLNSEVGPIPLSLEFFWREVGSVDFVGMHPEWPEGRDPLVVNGPEVPISEIELGIAEDQKQHGVEFFEASLAPDDLLKDNVSGGSPYAIRLPNAAADFIFQNERHGLHFVPYLRLAILKWGGFPGLEGQNITFTHLNELVADLEDF